MALDQTMLDDIAEKIAGGLRLIGNVKQGAEAQVKAVLQSAFDGLDVVTAERMQVAEAMLAKTQEKIRAMETRIAALESRPKKS